MASLEPLTFAIERSEAIDSVVASLVAAELRNGRYILQLPVLTGLGSLVSVSVYPEGAGGSWMVTDAGLAHFEVITAGGSERVFSSVAGRKCQASGANFDGGNMIFIRVSKDRLRGAIIAMGALIRAVIDETIEKSFSADTDAGKEVFVARAAEAYPEARRTERAKVSGQSTTTYEVDLLVDFQDRSLAFTYFTRAGNSVNSAYVTLSDIARLDAGPKPVGVTPLLDGVGPKLNLVSSVAAVIQSDVPVSTYRRLAA